MFSRKSRAPDQHEIIYLGEEFTWQEDDSVTERCRRKRKKQIWTTCGGAALALVVVGHAVGVSWLVTAVASNETARVQMR